MRTNKRGRTRLVYVLGEFPSLSETFILREMVTLEEMGFSLVPLSLSPRMEGPVHEQARPFVAHTLYRPSPFSGLTLGGLLKSMLQRPVGLLSAFFFALRHMLAHPRQAHELLTAFLGAAYFASRLSSRDTRHIHAHFASYPATTALLLAEICGSSYSFSCHANDIFTKASILLPRKLREADFVTVCTRYGLERLQRSHSLTSKDKLHLIYHGVDTSDLGRKPHREYPVPLIVSVGRLIEKKGFPFLLQAAAILAGQGLQFELVIVGDGPLRDELERLVGGLGLRERVVFAGRLTQEQLAHVYRRADVFCLASIVAKDGDRDGLPNVILEAMAYGVPVVASNLSAIPEAIIHEETGLLVPPGSPSELAVQLERALRDNDLRQRLIVQAKQKVQTDFDLRRNVARLGALFAGVLGLRGWSSTPPADHKPEGGSIEW